MKHIIIDARLYGPKHTGLGRYTKNLLLSLPKTKDFKKYKFTLLVYPELAQEIATDLDGHYRYVITNLRHYSISEQIFLPVLLKKLKPDLVHFTHLDKPIFYFGRSIVTIHDLIRHFSKGPDTTTRSPLLYWPKYWGYLLMTKIIFATSHLIVPSNYWRDYLIHKENINPTKVTTTYEAVDPTFLALKRQSALAPKRYILYTGNLYPHKNISVVLKAMESLPDLKLKIICARSLFQERLQKNTNPNQIEFLGYVDDKDFPRLYSQALALVHPSLIEGFSLTGLEAMALGCPVISSNTSCLPEIYQDSVLYFDPKKPSALVDQIKKLQLDPTLRQQLIDKGDKQVKKYSWLKTARETLNVYSQTI